MLRKKKRIVVYCAWCTREKEVYPYRYKQSKNKRFFCNRSCKAKWQSEKTRERMQGDKNFAKRPEVREKISAAKKGRPSALKGKTYKEIYGEGAEEQKRIRHLATKGKTYEEIYGDRDDEMRLKNRLGHKRLTTPEGFLNARRCYVCKEVFELEYSETICPLCWFKDTVLCACGCGELVPQKYAYHKSVYIKGHSMRGRKRPEHSHRMGNVGNPSYKPENHIEREPVLCACGCGQRVNSALQTDSKSGIRAGEPRKYVLGHHTRVRNNFMKVYGRIGSRKDLDHFVRSSWEANFARFLKWMNIEYEYEKHKFDVGENKYHPDFYLPEIDLFVEIKGWVRLKDAEKITSFREKYPEKRLVVCGGLEGDKTGVIDTDYLSFKKQFRTLVPNWE